MVFGVSKKKQKLSRKSYNELFLKHHIKVVIAPVCGTKQLFCFVLNTFFSKSSCLMMIQPLGVMATVSGLLAYPADTRIMDMQARTSSALHWLLFTV